MGKCGPLDLRYHWHHHYDRHHYHDGGYHGDEVNMIFTMMTDRTPNSLPVSIYLSPILPNYLHSPQIFKWLIMMECVCKCGQMVILSKNGPSQICICFVPKKIPDAKLLVFIILHHFFLFRQRLSHIEDNCWSKIVCWTEFPPKTCLGNKQHYMDFVCLFDYLFLDCERESVHCM